MSMNKWMNTKEYLIAYSILINAARHQGYATYQEIAQAIGLPTAGSYMGAVLGEILGLISENEIKNKRPMLSALAISVNGKPSKGFISYAKKLGLFCNSENEDEFWKQECKKIYDEWKVTYRISKKK